MRILSSRVSRPLDLSLRMLSGPSEPDRRAWRSRGGGGNPSRSSSASEMRVSSFRARSGTCSIGRPWARTNLQYPNKPRNAREVGTPPMDSATRDHLARALGWAEAHMSFDDAVADLPVALQGKVPSGLPYSPWQL